MILCENNTRTKTPLFFFRWSGIPFFVIIYKIAHDSLSNIRTSVIPSSQYSQLNHPKKHSKSILKRYTFPSSMASPTASPTSPITIPDFGNLYDPTTGRFWPFKAINEFIVGHLYSGWTFEHTVEYLQWVYHDFLHVTVHDVQHLWRDIIPASPHFQYWRSQNTFTPEVQQTLATIKIEWNMWRDPHLQIP